MKYILIGALLLFTACATSVHKNFSKVEVGMDKGQVLDLIGSPLHVKRNTETRIWIYRFYDKSGNEIRKEVQLESGRVVYVGDVKSPEKIINPNGAAYTEKDLEDYLIKESKKEQIKKPDTHDMEKEMLKDLGSDDSFVPID